MDWQVPATPQNVKVSLGKLLPGERVGWPVFRGHGILRRRGVPLEAPESRRIDISLLVLIHVR
jgi:hypothetical protein